MQPEYIGKIKEIAEQGKGAYRDNLEKILNGKIEKLRLELKECVKTHAKEYKLIVQNDVSSEIELYEMVDRVKSPESLKEKIIRNQVFFDLMDENGKAIGNGNKQLLAEVIKEKIDDLMGIRFLVSLSCDCEKIFELLKKCQEELAEKGIIFSDLEQNPQTMRNGRPIYRIKGKYKEQDKEEYPFELQIKSKVDSAWADIEHMLFYKDYQFSYIQSTNKQVMKKLGDLLEQVDELMIQIRESQASYEKDREEMEFTQYLGTRFKGKIQEIVGYTFVLSEYRRVLFNIFLCFGNQEKKIILDQKSSIMADEFYSLEVKDKKDRFVENYKKLTEKSLEFIILEHIYTDWLNCLGLIDSSRTVEVSILEQYFKRLITGLLKEKMEYYLGKDDRKDEYFKWVGETISDSLKEIENISFCLPVFLVDSEKMYMLYSFYIANTKAAGNKPKEIVELTKTINNEVIAFLFEDGISKEDKVSRAAENIKAKVKARKELNNYYPRTFIKNMDKVYGQVEKTISGKVMPKNVLLELFTKVLKEES